MCHFGRPSWWKGNTSICSNASPKVSQIFATFSTFSSEARHEHETHPDLLACLGQTLSEVDGRLQDAAGHLMVGLLIAGFDVKQAQVDVIHHVISVARTEESGRVEAGMHSHLLGGMEHA